MSVKELFEIWKVERLAPEAFKGNVCAHGLISGGPGYIGFDSCEHPDHTTVRYGCDQCPAVCPDYQVKSDDKLFIDFIIDYRDNASYYNEKYNIDVNDKYYRKGVAI